MARYRLTAGSDMLDTVTGKFIGGSSNNKDYRTYLEWLVQGNTPDTATVPEPDPDPVGRTLENPVFAAFVAVLADIDNTTPGDIIGRVRGKINGNPA